MISQWVKWSLTMNGVFLLGYLYGVIHHRVFIPKIQSPMPPSPTTLLISSRGTMTEGEKQKLSYEQWKEILKNEAQRVSEKQPKKLRILLGDSISLWFPDKLLPHDGYWLNQGISGETTRGLLNRLQFLDETNPEVIYIMIGINDLLKGVSNQTILANQELIIKHLKAYHPHSLIVIQSILPHQGEKATWEGKVKFKNVPLSRIQKLNDQLADMAKRQGIEYINLYPIFADSKGYLDSELTSDGLHLSPQGYRVWSIIIRVFQDIKL